MSIFRLTAAVIALSLGLSSCSSLAEFRAERQAARASADRSQCLDMGFKVGTDTYLLCLDNRNLLRKANNAATKARAAAYDNF